MLSYMLPPQDRPQAVEEKPLPPRSLNLNRNLDLTASLQNTKEGAGITTTTITTTITTSTIESKSMATASAGHPVGGTLSLNRKQNKNGNNVEICDETTKLLSNERAQIAKSGLMTPDQNYDNDELTVNIEKGKTSISDVCGANYVVSGGQQQRDDLSKNQNKKSKINKIGAKNTTLKRVSFGSSKGSMVETLIFETPTPLPEHAERVFGYPAENLNISSSLPQQHGHKTISTSKITTNNNNNNTSCLDDSGIDLQEESERSKVRVTFYQSNKPQQVSPPDCYLFYSDTSPPLLSDIYQLDGRNILPAEMAVETTAQISYDRQISTESGWDNPFRPGGDLSREADEIVNLIKGGKPITPTGDVNQSIANGTSRSIENGKAVLDGATKTEVSHLQSTPAQNGTKSSQSKLSAKTNDAKSTSQTQVSNQVIPGPTSASHVVIQDKKKKKCNCCVIQ